MKTYKLFKSLILFITLGFIIISCDDTDPSNYLKEKKDTVVVTSSQKVLLEEFTGHACVNCPRAHELASNLSEKYPNLIRITIHAGINANPNSAPDKYDFTTLEGTEFDKHFGSEAMGHPNGMVNRVPYNSSLILYEEDWESAIKAALKQTPPVALNLVTNYNSATRQITANVEVNYLKPGTADHRLVVLIQEDSIVKSQLGIVIDSVTGKKKEQFLPNYVHNRVLRKSMNGAWGEQLSDGIINTGAKINKSFSFTIPSGSDWRPSKLRILAYVCDKGKDYKILQAEQKELGK